MKEISFPVFSVGEVKPRYYDGIYLFSYTKVNLDTWEEKVTFRVLDDKNIEGETLGKRRLALKAANIPLKRLGRAVYFLDSLIKLAKTNKWFIDNNGVLFKYKPTEFAPVVYKRITKRFVIPTGGSIIEVDGITTRFKTLYTVRDTDRYAALIKYGSSYLLYGVYDTKYKDGRKKV